MTEFFNVQPPEAALELWLARVTHQTATERVNVYESLDRVLAESISSPSALPAFRRSTVDGYAVRAADTYGASSALPAYLSVVGEVGMGQEAALIVPAGSAVLIHTGGMVPPDADAVVMVEHTQQFSAGEIEVMRPVASGENVIQVGEDVARGEEILARGHRLTAQDVGALLASGITAEIPVMRRPVVSIFSTGDELVAPDTVEIHPGQVRDINSGTIQALAARAGAVAYRRGIIPDEPEALLAALRNDLVRSDMLVVTAGSSVSVRDMTADVINQLGEPGVLVHGVAARPGKPTILAVIGGKPVIGLPGNPVSAFVMFMLFGVPGIWHLVRTPTPLRSWMAARLTSNAPSVAGREDYVPVRLVQRDGEMWAEPVFGKSNLIFTLVNADGLLRIPLNVTGLREGTWGKVLLF